MSAETVIEQIRQLNPAELEKVSEFLADWKGDQLAAQRDDEIEERKVKTLSEEAVLARLKGRLE